MNYKNTSISFSEVPMEGASLIFWTSGCGMRCKGCQSPELRSHDGKPLTKYSLYKEIKQAGIYVTAILFMGGEWSDDLLALLKWVKLKFPQYKYGLYTGRRDVEVEWKQNLDYLKVGEWRESLGGLASPTTNQTFSVKKRGLWIDHTWEFTKE